VYAELDLNLLLLFVLDEKKALVLGRKNSAFASFLS